MATSRTGTTEWLRARATCIRHARRSGQSTCPLCGIELAWDTHNLPTSPEVDHIIPVAAGGTDEQSNLRVICMTCNRTRGKTLPTPILPVRTRLEW